MHLGGQYNKVAPQESRNKEVRLDGEIVKATTIEEWDDSKQLFLQPNGMNRDDSPLDNDLLVKRSKTEQSEPAIDANQKMQKENSKAPNDSSVKVTLRDVEKNSKDYYIANWGSEILIGQWIVQYKINVYVSSILAIVGTIIWVVEQELYVVYGKNSYTI